MLHFLLGVVVGLLLRNYISKLFGEAKSKFVANVLAGFQDKYNDRLRYRKQELLTKGLQRLQKKNGGRSLKIVEIGAGAGANFEFMPAGIKVTCVDPNRSFEGLLRANVKNFPGVEITELIEGFAENMSAIRTASADAVVCTLVLCSVNDVDKCLQETLRILKPGGQFFFLEHVSVDSHKCTSSLSYARALQKWLHYIWIAVLDCNTARKTHVNIERAGFSDVQMEHFDAVEVTQPNNILPFAAIIRPHLIGIATK